jgi:adenylate kinase
MQIVSSSTSYVKEVKTSMQILFLGAPGAGKGTQCKRLAAKLGISHLSSGDLLREAVKANTQAGQLAKSYMEKGVLVPDHVLIDMYKDKLSSPDCKKGFILDGFPRNLAQAKSLDDLLSEIGTGLTIVIDLAVDNSLLTERITGRRICSNKTCATPYHIKFAPPKVENKCDACGSDLMVRSDDREDLVASRLQTYNAETKPLIEYYNERNLLKTVKGEGNPESIFQDLINTIKERECSEV